MQFPETNGLLCTLLQGKERKPKISQGIQIIHARGDHWLVASTLNTAAGTNKIDIYDSSYNTVDEETKAVIKNLFQVDDNPNFILVQMQKQIGSADCGLFSIAMATALLFQSTVRQFKQEDMRQHLLLCFENKEMTIFP